jgi:hypothetical protein
MAAITKAAAVDVKPLEGAVIRRVTLGAATTAPAAITLQSDGKWDPTDMTGVQLTVALALQSGGDGDRVDAVFFGPAVALSGATVGSLVFASDTAGAFDTAVGTKDLVIGYAESATVLFVNPQIIDFA